MIRKTQFISDDSDKRHYKKAMNKQNEHFFSAHTNV